MLKQWRLLRRVTKVQGVHGGVMKDRNRPIDGIVSGPRLSLDRITDYICTVTCCTRKFNHKQNNNSSQ